MDKNTEEVSTQTESEETQEETQESSEETENESELQTEKLVETEADTTSAEKIDGEEKAHYEKRINDLMSRAMKAEAQLKENEQDNNIKTEEPQKFGEDYVPPDYDTLFEDFKKRMTNEQAQEAAKAESIRQADRAKLNNWYEATELKDTSFNRDSFLKFVGKVMEKGIRVDTNNLDGAYELYNMNRQSEKKGQEKVLNVKSVPDKVAPPSAKSAPSAGEVDASILKSRKSPVELAIEELRKGK